MDHRTIGLGQHPRPMNKSFASMFDDVAERALQEVKAELANARGSAVKWPAAWDEMGAQRGAGPAPTEPRLPVQPTREAP
jgi:hypothetical protein